MTHTILISIGSNIDREYYTQRALDGLKLEFTDVRHSSVYESASVGFDGSPFYNYVVAAKTHLPVKEVCATLKAIERQNGRTPSEKKFSSRTLDLDLLTYDELVCDNPISLPRDEITFNAFVLWPLAELVPNAVHPITRKTYAQMWAEFDQSSQSLKPINFAWSHARP